MTPLDVLEGRAGAVVVSGDSLDVLASFPAESFDAVVTDPPAGIGFMGRDWDADRGGRAEWVAWLASILREALRVLKPGGHAIVWALPRTQHWTATAVEDAGFEVRDVLAHVFGSGFPKSLNISKAIDKRRSDDGDVAEDSRAWEGWGTALKPAHEAWILARKPLGRNGQAHARNVAGNVLAYGTGGINVDACRVGSSKPDTRDLLGSTTNPNIGRWPTNLLFEHAPGCRVVGVEERWVGQAGASKGSPNLAMSGKNYPRDAKPHRFAPDGVERVACDAGCPVAGLDAQAGVRSSGAHRAGTTKGMGYRGGNGCVGSAIKASIGAASCFFPVFYAPKISMGEREGGARLLARRKLSDRLGVARSRENTHETVKPVALMRWLVRLVTTPGGVVLDPFAGSGATGIAALAEGFRFVGVELDERHAKIARRRIAVASRAKRDR